MCNRGKGCDWFGAYVWRSGERTGQWENHCTKNIYNEDESVPSSLTDSKRKLLTVGACEAILSLVRRMCYYGTSMRKRAGKERVEKDGNIPRPTLLPGCFQPAQLSQPIIVCIRSPFPLHLHMLRRPPTSLLRLFCHTPRTPGNVPWTPASRQSTI